MQAMAVSQTEDCILPKSHLQDAYVINPGLFQLIEHYSQVISILQQFMLNF